MVAISLHRGNLHKSPQEPPRKWLMPTPRISLHDFRRLTHRRSMSLSLLPSPSSPTTPQQLTQSNLEGESSAATENSNLSPERTRVAGESSGAIENPNVSPERTKLGGGSSGAIGNPNLCSEKTKLGGESLGASESPNVCSDRIVDDAVVIKESFQAEVVSGGIGNPNLCTDIIVSDAVAVAVATMEIDGAMEKEEEKGEGVDVENRISTSQENGNSDAIDEKERRKREVEEKLQILNEKKHNLVQALKQILNAEEELTRRSNVQANRPPLPLQVDVSNDSGSMTRLATPRTISEVNAAVDIEGGDNAVNHNSQPRQLLRLNSTSPSAESALRKPPFFQNSVASYPSRAAMVAAGSPSRFAPSGNQGQSSNMPTVSVSGTNYIPSSPSPAASGGTSCFRDTRQPSPWS